MSKLRMNASFNVCVFVYISKYTIHHTIQLPQDNLPARQVAGDDHQLSTIYSMYTLADGRNTPPVCNEFCRWSKLSTSEQDQTKCSLHIGTAFHLCYVNLGLVHTKYYVIVVHILTKAADTYSHFIWGQLRLGKPVATDHMGKKSMQRNISIRQISWGMRSDRVVRCEQVILYIRLNCTIIVHTDSKLISNNTTVNNTHQPDVSTFQLGDLCQLFAPLVSCLQRPPGRDVLLVSILSSCVVAQLLSVQHNYEPLQHHYTILRYSMKQ